MELFFTQQVICNWKLYDFNANLQSFLVLYLKVQNTTNFTMPLGSLLYALHIVARQWPCLQNDISSLPLAPHSLQFHPFPLLLFYKFYPPSLLSNSVEGSDWKVCLEHTWRRQTDINSRTLLSALEQSTAALNSAFSVNYRFRGV
jgi:hypothetical protein